MEIQENLYEIQERIKIAAEKSGRKEENIKLIGVTKTVGVDIVSKAIEIGIDNIGENRVQEIMEKHEKINQKVEWHMIGHLQTNKVKYIIDKVDLIHSLDRLSLAKELDRRASEHGINIDVLIQVNIAEEETKFGLSSEKVIPFIEEILDYKNINIKGLMTIAPYIEDSEEVRYVFRKLRELSEKIKMKKYIGVDMKYLSMGMTNDFEVAIEEGANIVRIGSGIFGKRKY